MGSGLGRTLTAYSDTHVLLWLLQGEFDRISPGALAAIEQENLLVSPMVLLELEYLFEIERSGFTAEELQFKMERELGAHVCALPFAQVIRAALQEKWTRDPFDRVIVAQAKANGLSVLVSADRKVAQHYPRAVW